jgi:hypothetical protein
MKKILLIASSLNQLAAMRALSKNLEEYQCCYRPIFINTSFFKVKRTWVSLLGHKLKNRKQDALIKAYCNKHDLRIDGEELDHPYDLVINYYDNPVTENFPHIGTICIEEIETSTKRRIVTKSIISFWLYCRRFYRNSSYRFDVYCVNSAHKKSQLHRSGISADKIIVIEEAKWASQVSNICRNFLELALVSSMPHQSLKKSRIKYLLGIYPY